MQLFSWGCVSFALSLLPSFNSQFNPKQAAWTLLCISIFRTRKMKNTVRYVYSKAWVSVISIRYQQAQKMAAQYREENITSLSIWEAQLKSLPRPISIIRLFSPPTPLHIIYPLLTESHRISTFYSLSLQAHHSSMHIRTRHSLFPSYNNLQDFLLEYINFTEDPIKLLMLCYPILHQFDHLQ